MANYKYAGMSLSDLKKSKGGLIKNLLQAKVQATAILHKKLELDVEPVVEEYQEEDADAVGLRRETVTRWEKYVKHSREKACYTPSLLSSNRTTSY